MIVVCKPEDSMAWYDKLWKMSVELFRSMDIPVRQLECCSGDLADLKVKILRHRGLEPPPAEVFRGLLLLQPGRRPGRRLKIRVKGEDGKMYLPTR
jgi:seryl-tRNA synthetase